MRNLSGTFISILLVLVTASVVLATSTGQCLAGEKAGDEVVIETKIKTASIYNGEVQIRRSGKVELGVGTFKLLCRDLPERFDEASLKVEGSGTAIARIIGVDLKRKKAAEYDEPRYRELHEAYVKLQKEYASLRTRSDALSNRKSLTKAIGQSRRDNAQKEFKAQAFDPDEWKKVLDFLEAEEIAVEKKLKTTSTEMKKVYDEMQHLRSEMTAMRSVEGKGRSVIIDCEVEKAGDLDIDIDYLVDGAKWEPEYSLRYIEDAGKVELTYNARISQSTGEDWDGVSVLLSTARPHSGAAPPRLVPHYLGTNKGVLSGTVTSSTTGRPLPYANIVIVGTRMGGMAKADGTYIISAVPPGTYTVKVMMMGYAIKEKTGVRVHGGQATIANFRLSEQVVGQTNEILVEAEAKQIDIKASDVRHKVTSQELEELPVDDVVEAIALKAGGAPSAVPIQHIRAETSRSGFAANLQIRKPVDLETGAEPKRSLVSRESLGGEFSLFAVPRLSGEVYLKGRLKNTLDIPLLEGSAEIFVETVPLEGGNRVSDFVGKDWIDPVASGEDFTLHLGIDQDIKVRHELAKKEYLTKLGKKEMKIRYSYLITVESFKKEQVVVEIADRLPVSLLKEIELDDLEITPEPFTQKENGLLSWKISVAPGTKQQISISYVVKFPGSMDEEGINLME